MNWEPQGAKSSVGFGHDFAKLFQYLQNVTLGKFDPSVGLYLQSLVNVWVNISRKFRFVKLLNCS